MKKNKWMRRVGMILSAIALLIVVAIIYTTVFLPAVPLDKSIIVKSTPERIARGRYLFETVAGCKDCHSSRDPKLFSMPVAEGSIGQGGQAFNNKLGFPGSFIAKNITPYQLGSWSDAALFRAITSGVSKDGHALFPIMPYQAFGQADKEDIYSIIAYTRTLSPIKKDWPASQADFPVNLLIHTIPAAAHLQPAPLKDDSRAYGGYLVNLAGCIHCHSVADKGKIIEGMQYAGGRQFPLPTGGTVASANITPDLETGIGGWTREIFMRRFMSYADSSYTPAPVTEGSFNTVMPWTQFGKMLPEDLSAIYDYLRTVKPVRNKVAKFLNDTTVKS